MKKTLAILISLFPLLVTAQWLQFTTSCVEIESDALEQRWGGCDEYREVSVDMDSQAVTICNHLGSCDTFNFDTFFQEEDLTDWLFSFQGVEQGRAEDTFVSRHFTISVYPADPFIMIYERYTLKSGGEVNFLSTYY